MSESATAPPTDGGAPMLPIHLPRPYARSFMRWVFHVAFPILGGLKVTGLENVPKTGPVLFCPNHISDCDPVALYASMPRADVYYMGKQELFDMKPGKFFRYHGGFPVKRNTADRAALRTGEAILKNGQSIVLFPEGGISESGLLRPLLPGAAMIAINGNAQIVPIGIVGTNRILRYGDIIPRRTNKPATVHFGPPILMEDFADMSHKAKIVAVTARIEAELRAMTGQIITAE